MELKVLLPSTDREQLMDVVSKRDAQSKQMLSDIIGDWMLSVQPLFGKYLILNYAKSSSYTDLFIEALKSRMLESGYCNNWDKFFSLLGNLTELWQLRALVAVFADMPQVNWEQEYWNRQKLFEGNVPKDKAENEYTRCLLLLKSLPATENLRISLMEKAEENSVIAEILKEKF